MSKPIAPETLLHAVQEALGDEPEVPPEVAPSAACVDLARLLRGLDGDVDLLDELIRVFRDDAERLLDAVESAVRNDDREALARAAHTIKGAVSNFAAGDAAAAARELERAAREGTDGAVRAGVSGVRKELDRLISCLGWLAEDGVPEDLRLVAE